MTTERAIEILNPEHREHYESIEIVEEACRMGMAALEKQTPKKPVKNSIIGKLKIPDIAYCPICDNPAIKDESDNYEQAYCCYCGQALDWKDNNDIN